MDDERDLSLGGRPLAVIDEQQLEKLAERQWTAIEIAAFFRVDRRTIERRFSTNIEEARQRGRAKLRDLQWKRAMEGSDRILIHMSEHYLGQRSTGINLINESETHNTVQVAQINNTINADGTKQKDTRQLMTELLGEVLGKKIVSQPT